MEEINNNASLEDVKKSIIEGLKENRPSGLLYSCRGFGAREMVLQVINELGLEYTENVEGKIYIL